MFIKGEFQSLMMGMSILLLIISIVFLVILGVLYQHLIDETENMSSTGNKMLKQCKLKFANCYRMNGGVANINVFVDKYMNRLKLGKWSFLTIYHMAGQAMLLSVFFAGAGACIGIMNGKMLGEVLPYYIVSFFGLYLYFSISSAVDVKGKVTVLKTNLVDYLENHMVQRLEFSELEENRENNAEKKLKPAISAKSLLSQMEEEELEDLLRELLV